MLRNRVLCCELVVASRVLLRHSVLLRNTALCFEWAIAQQSIYVYVHIYLYIYMLPVAYSQKKKCDKARCVNLFHLEGCATEANCAEMNFIYSKKMFDNLRKQNPFGVHGIGRFLDFLVATFSANSHF